MIVNDTLANRMFTFCTACGSGRLHRVKWGPLLYIEVCNVCKRKGQTATVERAVHHVVLALGGRWGLNSDESRQRDAARRIGVVLKRLGR